MSSKESTELAFRAIISGGVWENPASSPTADAAQLQRQLQQPQLRLMEYPQLYLAHLQSHELGRTPMHVYSRSVESAFTVKEGSISTHNHTSSKSSATSVGFEGLAVSHKENRQNDLQNRAAQVKNETGYRLSVERCIFCGSVNQENGGNQHIDYILQQEELGATAARNQLHSTTSSRTN